MKRVDANVKLDERRYPLPDETTAEYMTHESKQALWRRLRSRTMPEQIHDPTKTLNRHLKELVG